MGNLHISGFGPPCHMQSSNDSVVAAIKMQTEAGRRVRSKPAILHALSIGCLSP